MVSRWLEETGCKLLPLNHDSVDVTLEACLERLPNEFVNFATLCIRCPGSPWLSLAVLPLYGE